MSETTTTETRIAAGPFTNRSNANRAMKRLLASNPGRNLLVSDDDEAGTSTGGEEYRVFERVLDGETEHPNGTPALDMPVSDRIKAGLRGDLALDEKSGVLVVDRKPTTPDVPDTADPVATMIAQEKGKGRKAAATSTVTEAGDLALEPAIPGNAEVIEKRVRCGAGTVTYTHRAKDGSAFVFGRWVADPADSDSDVVVFARGAGWWKNGRKVDAKSLAGAFEA